MRDQQLYLDGRWVDGQSRLPVRSPYDDTGLGAYAVATPAQVTAAISAAHRAFGDGLPAHRRAAVLDDAAAIVARRREEIARTLSAEAGKPITAARAEVDRGLTTCGCRPTRPGGCPAKPCNWTASPSATGCSA